MQCGNIREIKFNNAYQDNSVIKAWRDIINVSSFSLRSLAGRLSLNFKMIQILKQENRNAKKAKNII